MGPDLDRPRRAAARKLLVGVAVLAALGGVVRWAGQAVRTRGGKRTPVGHASDGYRPGLTYGSGEDERRDLPPPEPALKGSARRLFSSPGGEAGGLAATQEERAAAAAAAARLTGADPNLPSGGFAPTAALTEAQRAALEAAAPGAKPGASKKAEAGPSGGETFGGAKRSEPPPGPRAPVLGSAGEGGLDSAARSFTRDAKSQRSLSEPGGGAMSLKSQVAAAAAAEQRLDDGLRSAIGALGPSPSPQAVAKAAEGVLKDQGLSKDDVDLETAVARAQAPPQPPVPPEVVAANVQQLVADNPLSPAQLADLKREEQSPPPKVSPPPKGAIDAYRKYGDVLDKTEKDFGVKPQHVLGILGVETGYGRNVGNYPVASTLLAISQRRNSDGTPTKAAKQASRDLTALGRLKANGELTGSERVNYAGAMGIPQFLVSSWEAYARSPNGGKRDPFDFPTAAYSVGSYLKSNGYAKSVDGSFFRYNHSQEYVEKVKGIAASVEQAIKKEPK